MPIKKPCQTSQIGRERDTTLNCCHCQALLWIVAQNTAALTGTLRPAFPERRMSDGRPATCPISFVRREYCREDRNQCAPRIRSPCTPSPTVSFAAQCVHRAKADDRPWATPP